MPKKLAQKLSETCFSCGLSVCTCVNVCCFTLEYISVIPISIIANNLVSSQCTRLTFPCMSISMAFYIASVELKVLADFYCKNILINPSLCLAVIPALAVNSVLFRSSCLVSLKDNCLLYNPCSSGDYMAVLNAESDSRPTISNSDNLLSDDDSNLFKMLSAPCLFSKGSKLKSD